MEKKSGFPYRFFVVTFIWSWLIWLPLVLAGAGILPLKNDVLSDGQHASVNTGGFWTGGWGVLFLANIERQGCHSPIFKWFVGF